MNDSSKKEESEGKATSQMISKDGTETWTTPKVGKYIDFIRGIRREEVRKVISGRSYMVQKSSISIAIKETGIKGVDVAKMFKIIVQKTGGN